MTLFIKLLFSIHVNCNKERKKERRINSINSLTFYFPKNKYFFSYIENKLKLIKFLANLKKMISKNVSSKLIHISALTFKLLNSKSILVQSRNFLHSLFLSSSVIFLVNVTKITFERCRTFCLELLRIIQDVTWTMQR